jgi:hypothetical protein
MSSYFELCHYYSKCAIYKQPWLVNKCNCSSQKPLPLSKFEPRTSGFVVLTSDHWTSQPSIHTYIVCSICASEGTLSRWSQLHLQSLAPTPFISQHLLMSQVSVRIDVKQIVKIIAKSLSQHDEKHVPTLLSGIR